MLTTFTSGIDGVIDDLQWAADHRAGFEPISAALPWTERHALYRRNYAVKRAKVRDGIGTWFDRSAGEIADWDTLLTPIELAMWDHLRRFRLPLWPQLPVGRYVLDFGNPVLRLGIECDGRGAHVDLERDNARDFEMASDGWSIVRVPGSLCLAPLDASEPGIDASDIRRLLGWRYLGFGSILPLLTTLQDFCGVQAGMIPIEPREAMGDWDDFYDDESDARAVL